jgi:cell wall-associated NlpC family hydrolase
LNRDASTAPGGTRDGARDAARGAFARTGADAPSARRQPATRSARTGPGPRSAPTAPGPRSARTTPPATTRGRRLLLSALAVVCAALAFSAPGSALAAPFPEPGSAGVTSRSPGEELSNAELEAVRARIDDLYERAGRASEAYNAAEEKRADQAGKVAALNDRVVRGEQRLTALRGRLTAAAIAQYRDQGGGLSVQQRLLLSDDPDDFLRAAELAKEGDKGSAILLGRVRDTQRALTRDKKSATVALHRLERAEKAKAAARTEVREEIEAAKAVESRLEEKERERLRELEKAEAARAQARLLDSGALSEAGTASAADKAGTGAHASAVTATGASEQGAKAVAFATAQLGKPYVWAAEGPDSFDCSGLTSQAWAAAGRIIPRTSQEQWRRLQHVPLSGLRPGDLVIYHADASHVGIYIGGGNIIHAPRPGRSVTIAGVGSMQILGAVRPDPEAAAKKEKEKEKERGKGREGRGGQKDAGKESGKASGKGADKTSGKGTGKASGKGGGKHGGTRDAQRTSAGEAANQDESPVGD